MPRPTTTNYSYSNLNSHYGFKQPIQKKKESLDLIGWLSGADKGGNIVNRAITVVTRCAVLGFSTAGAFYLLGKGIELGTDSVCNYAKTFPSLSNRVNLDSVCENLASVAPKIVGVSKYIFAGTAVPLYILGEQALSAVGRVAVGVSNFFHKEAVPANGPAIDGGVDTYPAIAMNTIFKPLLQLTQTAAARLPDTVGNFLRNLMQCPAQ